MSEHLHGLNRTGSRRYESRPPANCRSARKAWDSHATSGPIVWLQLVEGCWGAKRPNGDIDELDNLFAQAREAPQTR